MIVCIRHRGGKWVGSLGTPSPARTGHGSDKSCRGSSDGARVGVACAMGTVRPSQAKPCLVHARHGLTCLFFKTVYNGYGIFFAFFFFAQSPQRLQLQALGVILSTLFAYFPPTVKMAIGWEGCLQFLFAKKNIFFPINNSSSA